MACGSLALLALGALLNANLGGSRTVQKDIAQFFPNDDGPDSYWGATEMACMQQEYESTDPYHFSCDEFLGVMPDNTTCADPDSYMVKRCQEDSWCRALCPDDLSRHTVALCAFTALSDMPSTCEWVRERSARMKRRGLLRSEVAQEGSSSNEANEVMCDRVAYCNLCGDQCRRLINPTIRSHHLASMLHGREDDDGKAAWVAIPLIRHLPKLCDCLR